MEYNCIFKFLGYLKLGFMFGLIVSSQDFHCFNYFYVQFVFYHVCLFVCLFFFFIFLFFVILKLVCECYIFLLLRRKIQLNDYNLKYGWKFYSVKKLFDSFEEIDKAIQLDKMTEVRILEFSKITNMIFKMCVL